MTAESAHLRPLGEPLLTKPPSGLSAATKRWWTQILLNYELGPADLRVLHACCSAWDRMTEAQRAVKKDGAYVQGRFGMKAHPGLQVERDSRTAFLRALRELGLDAEPPPQPSRPPRRY